MAPGSRIPATPPEGLIILLPRSKTDQEGSGLSRALPKGTEAVCPLQALKVWLDAADITEGVIFRPVNRWDTVQQRALQASAINALLKELGQACAFDFTPDLSSHSLRRGLSTSAAREQAPFEAIKKQGGWKNDATVREYIDEGNLFTENAALPLLAKLAEKMQ